MPFDKATIERIREQARGETEAAEVDRARKKGWLNRAPQREFGERVQPPAPADQPPDEDEAPARALASD